MIVRRTHANLARRAAAFCAAPLFLCGRLTVGFALVFLLRSLKDRFVMAALRSRCGHYIFALWFLSFLFLA